MHIVNDVFKTNVKANVREFDVYLYHKKAGEGAFTLVSAENNAEIDDLISFQWKRNLQADEALTGNAVCQELVVNLFDINNRYGNWSKGDMIKVEIGKKGTLHTDAGAFVCSPTFYIDNISLDDVNKTATVTGYDVLSLMNKPMNDVFDMSNKGDSSLKSNPYSSGMTCMQYANALCEGFDLSFDNTCMSGFYETDIPLIHEPNLSGSEVAREVLGKIAQIYFANVYVKSDDTITFVSLVDNSPVTQIDSNHYFDFVELDKFPSVNTLNIAFEPQQDYFYAEDSSATKTHEFKITNNPFLDNQRNESYIISGVEQKIIDVMFDKIKGFSAVSYEMEWRSFIYLEPGDKICIMTPTNKVINTYVGNSILSYDGGFISSDNLYVENNDSNLSLASDLVEFAKKTELYVDKLNGEIVALADDLHKMGNLDERFRNVEQLVLNAQNGLTNTFTTTGGSNLLRNTSFKFEESDNKYEFWEGIFSVNTTCEDSSTFTSLLLDGNARQTVSGLTPGKYVLKFKYRCNADDPDTTGSVSIVNMDNIDDKSIVSALSHTQDGTVEVKFQLVSDGVALTDSAEFRELHVGDIEVQFSGADFEIWDIMLNMGENAVVYSQHANEMCSDTVNISKGVTVSSSNGAYSSKLEDTGFELRQGNDEKVDINVENATFNVPLNTKDANLDGLRVMRYNNQIWILEVSN